MMKAILDRIAASGPAELPKYEEAYVKDCYQDKPEYIEIHGFLQPYSTASGAGSVADGPALANLASR